MNKLALVLLTGILLTFCSQNKNPASQSPDANELAEESLTAALDSISKGSKIPGFAVAISDQEGTLYERGFGYADLNAKLGYTQNTIQHIASVSKTFIGIALIKAREMGKLKLDDPIQDYLPFDVNNPYHPGEPITIRHLATHTAGINDTEQYMSKSWIVTDNQDLEGISTEYHAQTLNPWEQNMPMEAFLKGYLEVGGPFYQEDSYIDFKPGERFNYSNIGATLVAIVIEKATGQPFDKFTEEHLLQPLGMKASGWSLNEVDLSKHSRLYRSDSSLLPFYTAITYPDGMFISSSHDMAIYLTELIKGYTGEGTLLSEEGYEEFFRKQLTENNFEEGSRDASHPYDGDYDPAIFIGHSAHGFVGHSGGDAGVATWLYFDKEAKTGAYMVINSDIGDRKTELDYYAIWGELIAHIGRSNE